MADDAPMVDELVSIGDIVNGPAPERAPISRASIETERALLGSVLRGGPASMEEAEAEGVTLADFGDSKHRILWIALQTLSKRGMVIDVTTVGAELERIGKLDRAGGYVLLSELHAYGIAAHIASYALDLRDLAQRRRVAEAAERLAQQARTSTVALDVAISQARAQMELREPVSDKGFAVALKQARAELANEGFSSGPRRREPMLWRVADHAGETIEVEPWLVPGIIKERGVLVVGGEPKMMKTWVGLEMCMAVATGTAVFGEFKTGRPRPAAAFLVEDGKKSVLDRMRALATSRGMDLEGAGDRLYVQERKPLDLRNQDDVVHLLASIRALPEPPALLMLDPLRDLHSGDENKSEDMSPVMHTLRALRNILGCAVVFVHHTSKQSKETKDRRPAQMLRGSSAIHGAVDGSLIFLEQKGDGRNVFDMNLHAETRAGRSAGRFWVRLEIEDDEHGDALETRWAFSRERSDAPSDAGPELTARQRGMISYLQKRWMAAVVQGHEPTPAGMRELAAAFQCNPRTATADIKRIAATGRADFLGPEEGVRTNAQTGWVYRPTADEEDDFTQ